MTFLQGIGNWDSLDLYWYNNKEAEGVQNYPQGIHKYYDVYSFKGYLKFLMDYVLVILFQSWTVITVLPIDIWFGIYTKDTQNWPHAMAYIVLSLVSPFLAKYMFWIL